MISVIIPTYNESGQIERTLKSIFQHACAEHLTEVIVVDGGSTDNTILLASKAGGKVGKSKIKGRAAQLNSGAALATGSILYFLNADTIPPPGFSNEIIKAVQTGKTCGSFRLAFDENHWFLKVNAWFTRFNLNCFRFGDQSLFVVKSLFEQTGGFKENHLLLEDQEIIKRLNKKGKFILIPKPVITSARKYRANGIYKTQAVFFLIYLLYQLGLTQNKLVRIYKKLLK